MASCRALLIQLTLRVRARALARAGVSKLARTAMIAMTTRSSTSVNPVGARCKGRNDATVFMTRRQEARVLRIRRIVAEPRFYGNQALRGAPRKTIQRQKLTQSLRTRKI